MSRRSILTVLAAAYMSFSCICSTERNYWIYERIDLSWYEHESAGRMVDTIMADTLYLLLGSEVDFLAQENLFTLPAANGLYALSCPTPGESGPKFRLTRAELSANRSYGGTPAGSSLNEQIRYGLLYGGGQPYFASQTFPLDSLTIQLNQSYSPYGPAGAFFILPKPTEGPASYSFQLTIEDETGRSWETNSRPVFWR